MFSLAAQNAAAPSGIFIFVLYAAIFAGFYFLFLRPQKKEQKRVQAMLADLEVGDTGCHRGVWKQQKLPHPDAESCHRSGGEGVCGRVRALRNFYGQES